ncbi:hypothetical protein [Selenomonas sp. AB3002]|uniref:hypothetical protein n=1 Tax=Selenomonas sp. AB3002 TaxID=1392502 RepID=UPI000496B146
MNQFKKEVLSIISKEEKIKLPYLPENLKDESITNILGMDIYHMLHAIFLYTEFPNITSSKIQHIVECKQKIILTSIHEYLLDVIDETHHSSLNNIPKLIVLMCNKFGFCDTYNKLKPFFSIDYSRELSVTNLGKKYYILTNKENALNVVKTFSLDNSYFHISQIEEAITFRFSRDHSGIYKTNEALHTTGIYVTQYLATEYILRRYTVANSMELFHLKGLLLNINEMYKLLPNNLHSYLDAEKNRVIENLNIRFSCNDISLAYPFLYLTLFKCIIAILFINHLENQPTNDFTSLKGKHVNNFVLCGKLFKRYINKKFNPPDCNLYTRRTFLYYFAETNHLYFRELEKTKYNSKLCRLSITGGAKEHPLKINASIHYTNFDELYRLSLSQLANSCKEECLLKEELYSCLNVYNYDTYNPIGIFPTDNENKTGSTTTSNQQKTNLLQQATPKKASKDNQVKRKIKPNDNINFDGSQHTLYIMRKDPKCINKHSVISVTGILTSLTGRPIRINVNYCENCNRFYIHEMDFDMYRKRYRILLGKISLDFISFPKQTGQFNLAAESPLRLCGYTVNQQDNYSESERHAILANIMNHKIMKKAEILKYLHFYIQTQGGNKRKALAVSKWEDDLDFVNNYNLNKQQKYKINKIS